MSAPFGPKATATAEVGDLLMITRGTGAALEVEKVDPTDAATAALIAAGLDVLFGSDDWRSGGGTGADGDFYLRTSDWTIWGPKTAGAWGSPTSLVGTAGGNGTNGTNGAAFHAGAGTPSSGL